MHTHTYFKPLNHFQMFQNASYDDNELRCLIEKYPAKAELDKKIRKLLISVQSFRNATALNTRLVSFKDIRDQTNTDGDLIAKMNKMALAIKTAQKERDAQIDKDDFKTFENAISYALGSVAERLRKLYEIDPQDNILRLYHNDQSQLKKILPPVMLPKSRFRAI